MALDNAGNYEEALPLYINALEYFKTHLKYEKNPKAKEILTSKFTEYLQRAEEIRQVLDGNKGGGGDTAVGMKPKPKNGKPEEDNDKEKEKLQGALGSAIVMEKPNITWDDVAGLENAKAALKEAVVLPVKFPQFFTGNRKPWSASISLG